MKFEVPGRPVPKQRPRLGRFGKTYTPQRTRVYEETVAWYAKAASTGLTFAGRVSVRIDLHAKTTLRGDVDNYAKSILDGLQHSGVIRDDSQVGALTVVVVDDAVDDKAVVEIRELDRTKHPIAGVSVSHEISVGGQIVPDAMLEI